MKNLALKSTTSHLATDW